MRESDPSMNVQSTQHPPSQGVRNGGRCFVLFCAALCSLTPLLNADDGVHLSESAGTITMDNGLVTAVIDKEKAEITTVTLRGARNLLSPRGVTFDAEGFGVGKNEAGLRGGQAMIVSSGPDIAEVKFTDPSFVMNFLNAEMHFVMKKGVPGVYEYLVMRHGPGQPAGSVGQLRWVFRGDSRLLNHAFGSATKQGRMISQDAFSGAKQIADATFRLDPARAERFYPEPMGHTFDGAPVYSKYDWTDYAENHMAHGFSSDNEGIFMIQPSMEYYNGGPTKGILTVHNGPVSILEFLGGHFLIRDGITVHLQENESWQQIIGPWLVYLNKGSGADALWKDAFDRARTEKTSWPYDWVREEESLYPRNRGTVSGQISLPDPKTPLSDALVVLASPDKDWQVQTMGYEFWTRTDSRGEFAIPKVRPGNYALYASVPGVVGELKVTGVNVAPGSTNVLGTVHWNPPSREKLIWRVGVPDRTTREFRFGSESRQFGLWWKYMKEMGMRDLNFTVGNSDPAKDWYYAQSVVPMPDGSYFAPVWNINFKLADRDKEIPAGPATLTVDMAGACGRNNRLHVSVNGRETGIIDSINDSGIYRSAVQSADFRHHVIEFDSSMLTAGSNTVSFSLESKGNWKKGDVQSVISTDTSRMPEVPASGVMYDCIQLEAGAVKGDGSYQLEPARRLNESASPSSPSVPPSVKQ